MFIAMGYTKVGNDQLVLKGQLCMDQVANVSRDALLAYVECQVTVAYILLDNCI